MSDKQNKVVLITGASSGIGESAAYLLAQQGHRVVLGARREERLKQIVEKIRAAGGEAACKKLDVTKREDMDAFARFALDTYGRIDVLVNNAGLMPLSPLASQKVDEWDRMVDVNIKGVLYGIAAVLPQMKQQKGGQIINISSVAGLRSIPMGAVYCGTKAAVRFISEGLRQEEQDVRVCVICPGATESELADTITDPQAREMVGNYRKEIIPADAVARAIGFAVSEPADVDVNEIVVRPTVTTR